MRTARFWWLGIGFTSNLYAWYAIQVHQTKYLNDIGFPSDVAAYALGLVGLTGSFGQISLGHLSDRIGREWVWTIGVSGFALCYALLLLMQQHPTPALLYLMVAARFLGYGCASVYGSVTQNSSRQTLWRDFARWCGGKPYAGLGPWRGAMIARALHVCIGDGHGFSLLPV
jgi:MFS family permease